MAQKYALALSKACRANLLPDILSLIKTAHSQTPATYPSILDEALRKALYHKCSPHIIEHLVDSEKAPLDKLSVSYVARSAAIPVLEILLAHGWDINRPGDNSGETVIYHTLHDDAVVRWLVGHGADVSIGEFEYLTNNRFQPRPAPLLEECASRGSLASFKYLRGKGARLSRRTLHRAVQNAAAIGADPAVIEPSKRLNEDDEDFVNRQERGRILRYLIDELKLDVNELDADVPAQMHWGPPLNYAAQETAGAAVVRWLLDKGADPTLRSLEGRQDAEDVAKTTGSEDMVEIIRHWKQERNAS